jgi:hypothetical protein
MDVYLDEHGVDDAASHCGDACRDDLETERLERPAHRRHDAPRLTVPQAHHRQLITYFRHLQLHKPQYTVWLFSCVFIMVSLHKIIT